MSQSGPDVGVPSGQGRFRVIDPVYRPDLLDRLNVLVELGLDADPVSVRAVVPAHRLIRCYGEYLDPTLQLSVSREAGLAGYDNFVQRGGVHRLWDALRSYRVTHSKEMFVDVPIAQIHHPGMESSSAWIERSTAKRRSSKARVRVFGCGGGRECHTTIEYTERTIVDRRPCQKVLLPVFVRAQIRESDYDRRVHIDILEIRDGVLDNVDLETAQDGCYATEDQAKARGWKVTSLRFQGHGTKEISKKLTVETGYNGSAGLEIGGLSATVEAEITWGESTSWGYSLQLGHEYRVYETGFASGYLWPRF